MRRMILVLSAGAIMAAMVLALSVPAFADHKPPDTSHCVKVDEGENVYSEDCSGGGSFNEPGGASDGGNVSGSGGHTTTDCYGWDSYCDYSGAGGGGGRFVDESGEVISGGSGGRCEYSTSGPSDCVGEGYTGRAA